MFSLLLLLLLLTGWARRTPDGGCNKCIKKPTYIARMWAGAVHLLASGGVLRRFRNLVTVQLLNPSSVVP